MQQQLIMILLISLLTIGSAKEVFVEKDELNLSYIKLSESYCKSIKAEKKLCKEKRIHYIDYSDPDIPTFLSKLETHLSQTLKVYHEDNLKKSTLSDVKEFNGDISGEWYNEASIDLFSKTPLTYTLSTTVNGYTGGAHGYYGLSFTNYSLKTHQSISLDELFLTDSNQTLHRIALSHYRDTFELKNNQTLQDDGWFNNEFVLAENFALTVQGIYFLYNQYEIKAYSSGLTEFMLPYSKLYSIIDPNGILGFTLKQKKTFHNSFYDEEAMFISIDSKRNTDNTITITAKMKNLSFLNKGWFSLSFPQLNSKKQVVKMKKDGFAQLKVYPEGSKIYHNLHKKAIRSSYLLIEAQDTNWNTDDTHIITTTIKPPSNIKELIINIRGTLKSKSKSILVPSEYDGLKGQQGYGNYRVFIEL